MCIITYMYLCRTRTVQATFWQETSSCFFNTTPTLRSVRSIHGCKAYCYMYGYICTFVYTYLPTGIDDLQEVCEALKDIGKEWFGLGLALGLRQPTLQRIRYDSYNIDDRKREMLTQWLNQVDNSNPSWKSLVDALRNSTVQCEPVASIIEQKHLM